MKSFFLVFILSLSFVTLFAQDEDSVTNEYSDYVADDSSEEVNHVILEPQNLESVKSYKEEKINLKKFDKESWKKVIRETDYTEQKPEGSEEESKKPKQAMQSEPWNSFILSVVVYALVGGLVIFLLYQISKNISLDNIKIRKKLVVVDEYEAPVENIGELDVQQLLQQALSNENFKLAVRIYYLGLLKKLDEVEIIIWKKNKTNRDYLMELFSKDFYYDEINRLTILYEQVWYGEYAVSKEMYERLASNFEMMNQKITTTKSS